MRCLSQVFSVNATLEMGLGKTVQAILFILAVIGKEKKKNLLYYSDNESEEQEKNSLEHEAADIGSDLEILDSELIRNETQKSKPNEGIDTEASDSDVFEMVGLNKKGNSAVVLLVTPATIMRQVYNTIYHR